MTWSKKLYAGWLDDEIKGVRAWVYGKTLSIEAALYKQLVAQTAILELKRFFKAYFQIELMSVSSEEIAKDSEQSLAKFRVSLEESLGSEAYAFEVDSDALVLKTGDGKGLLYGVFKLMAYLKMDQPLESLEGVERPVNALRMLNHWDNLDGSIERGYAGQSIFYQNNEIVKDLSRLKDYARLLASIGINALSINNVNVHKLETKLITAPYLKQVAEVAKVFRAYGIQIFLSINFAAPIEVGGLSTADPLDSQVKTWWRQRVQAIYEEIPDLGGFLVKADSENRPGPFTYHRSQAEGANVLAEALEPYKGLLIWRCFVYNCHVDWRDRKSDRAKAAYDYFQPLDGQFMDNVILQIKNGPMDFQIREPLSPLFGAMPHTNQMMEFQITQEYTGQQKHICFLVPMWKECLEFDTYAKGEGTYIKDIVSGKSFGNRHSGLAAVANIGDSNCWCGNPMAAANLYGYGRLSWNPNLSSEDIAEEWIRLTLGNESSVIEVVKQILLQSRKAYEDYTVPLGIGWMVNVGHHYGPNIEGYEYSSWGTYHYADFKGIGVDRTCKTGTGYTGQYFEPNRSQYEQLETCPEALLLFFHHVAYGHRLKDGRSLQQTIYDLHFEGVQKVERFIRLWQDLQGKVEPSFYEAVAKGLEIQYKDAIEWRDIVNTYFYRKTGVLDQKHRLIYP